MQNKDYKNQKNPAGNEASVNNFYNSGDIQNHNSNQGRRRHYIHGDESQTNPNKYFCARCDDEHDQDHFFDLKYHTGSAGILSHLNRRQDDLEIWRFSSFLGETIGYDGALYYRYEHSPNIFKDQVKIFRSKTKDA